MKKWYVVHTQVNKESYAAQQLAQQGFETYLPRYKKTRRHARKTDEILAPLFPRYLFVHIDLENARWRAIASTYGVSGLVSAGNDPIAVPDEIIAVIQNQANDTGVIILPKVAFKAGETVHVREGAFEGYNAILECQDDSERVTLLINLLNREIRVKTTLEAIEKIDPVQ